MRVNTRKQMLKMIKSLALEMYRDYNVVGEIDVNILNYLADAIAELKIINRK